MTIQDDDDLPRNTYHQEITFSGLDNSEPLISNVLDTFGIPDFDSCDDQMYWVRMIEAHSAYAAAGSTLSQIIEFSREHPHIWVRTETFESNCEERKSLIFIVARGVWIDHYQRTPMAAYFTYEQNGGDESPVATDDLDARSAETALLVYREREGHIPHHMPSNM